MSFANAGGTLDFPGGTLAIDGGSFDPGSSSAYSLDGADDPELGLTNGASLSLSTGYGELRVGESAQGTLKVLSGSTVSVITGRVGFLAGSDGEVQVSGAGSTWSCDSLIIALNGQGTLSVTGGGLVTVGTGSSAVGNSSGSAGVVTVDGAGSRLAYEGSLDIGGSTGGTGTVTVANDGNLSVGETLRIRPAGTLVVRTGGEVSSGAGVIESATTATVEGAGSTWAVAGDLHVAQANSGRLVLRDGGNVAVGGQMYVGTGSGAGRLEWLGGTLTASGLTLGAHGTLAMGHDFDLADLAAGGCTGGTLTGLDAATLEVTAGATASLSAGSATVGSYTQTDGGTLSFTGGTLTIDGGTFAHGGSSCTVEGAGNPTLVLDDAAMSTSQHLIVGDHAPGTLRLDGGTVQVGGNFYVGRYGAGAVSQTAGTATMSGSLNLGRYADGHGTYDLSGGTVEAADLFAGDQGAGELTVRGTGAMTVTRARLGYQSGGDSVVTVNGAGASLTIEDYLGVGYADGASGVLRIENGGTVSTVRAEVARVTGSQGYVDAVSGTWAVSGSAYVGGSSTADGGTGTVAVRTAGTVQVGETLKLRPAGTLHVYGGIVTARDLDISEGTFDFRGGTVRVDGGTLTPGAGSFVFDATGYGSSSLDLANGAQLNTGTNSIYVGRNGYASLTIQSGSDVTSGYSVVGSGTYEQRQVGSVVVDGAGSTWQINGGLSLGQYGQGVLTVSAGASVQSQGALIGDYTYHYDAYFGGYMGYGTLTVTGAGSTWRSFDGTSYWSINVGDNGVGYLNVLDGGLVESWTGYIGTYAASAGYVTVGSGSGASVWNSTGDVHVGYWGYGELRVRDGGRVSAEYVRIGMDGGDGRLEFFGGQLGVYGTIEGIWIGSKGTVAVGVNFDGEDLRRGKTFTGHTYGIYPESTWVSGLGNATLEVTNGATCTLNNDWSVNGYWYAYDNLTVSKLRVGSSDGSGTVVLWDSTLTASEVRVGADGGNGRFSWGYYSYEAGGTWYRALDTDKMVLGSLGTLAIRFSFDAGELASGALLQSGGGTMEGLALGTLEITNGATGTAGTGDSLTVGAIHLGSYTYGGSGNLVISGGTVSAGSIVRAAGSLEFLSGTLNITGSGGLDIAVGGPFGAELTLTAGKTLNVSHTARIPAGSSLFVGEGSYSAGTTELSGGTLMSVHALILATGKKITGAGTVYGPVDLDGGALVGSGDGLVLYGDLDGEGSVSGTTIYGQINPGHSPGAMTFQDVIFGPSTVLTMELGGTDPGLCDEVLFVGLAHLGGTLDVRLIDVFQPAEGDRFDLFDWDSCTGQFARIDLPALPGDLTWDTSRLYTDGAIGVVPEPAVLALLSVGGLLLASKRRR